jgi:hypothetical protein
VIASGLKTNTSLRILDVTDNGMDDEAVAVAAHDETNVEFVSLDFNVFGDDGVAAFSQMLAASSSVTKRTSLAIANLPLAPITWQTTSEPMRHSGP